MSQIKNIQLLLIFAGILLLAGCRNESVEQPADSKQETMIELVPLTTRYVDIQNMSTRADFLPPGFVPYDDLYPTTTPPNKTIGVFLTPEKETSIGNFIYEGKDDNDISIWKSTVMVSAGTNYYIYGYMPHLDADIASITPLNGNYANGAILHIDNYTTLTSADVCAVVGVRNATASEKINGPEDYINQGFFFYEGQVSGENCLFVLLKHLYAGVHFKAFIGSKYHKMRDIKITGLRLEAQNIPNTVDLTLTLTANDTNTNPLVATYDLAEETGTQSVPLFPYEGVSEYEVKEKDEDPEPEGFLGCFVPGQPDSTHPLAFVLHTTYNVYDKEGTCIRQGCEASNIINPQEIPGFDNIGAGDVFTVNLLIEPDFLYVLSDPDLDNPTIITTP